MKCLLVEPLFHTLMGFHRFYYPMGLALMAAVLRQHGHNILYDTIGPWIREIVGV